MGSVFDMDCDPSFSRKAPNSEDLQRGSSYGCRIDRRSRIAARYLRAACPGGRLEIGRAQQRHHHSFASWRGTGLGVVSGWIDWKNGWSGMYSYASGTQPRTLRAKSANVSFGHGLFPKGGSLAACANGDYDGEQREVARRLAANGAGDAEIRLGWEASGDWFPWSAAGKSAEQWKSCFTRVAKAMKAGAPKLRIGWFMAKKGPGRRAHDLPGRRADHQHRHQPLRRRVGPVRRRDLSGRARGACAPGSNSRGARARSSRSASGAWAGAATTRDTSRTCTIS